MPRSLPAGPIPAIASEIGAADFAAALAAAPIAVLLADPAGRYIKVNAAACRILGRSEEELLGMNFLSLTHPENLENELQGVSQVLSGEIERFETESRWFHHSGEILWVKVSVSAVRDAHDDVQFYVAGVEDVTARKRAEAEEKRLQEIVRRNETIVAMGGLVGGVAHEVRNPLFAITATLDAMENRLGERAEYSRYVKVLRAEAARMTELMQRLLAYGKPVIAEHSAGDLREVIESAIKIAGLTSGPRQVGFEIQLAANPVIVAMDASRLVAVFQNLLDNAIHFSAPGGRIEVQLSIENGSAECRIRDFGPGFKADEVQRAFQPFFTRRPGGTGLGLSIVQKTLHEHHGEVRAENHPEGGALLTVTLPLAAAQLRAS